MSLISCNNLALGYDGKSVVSGLSFTVCEGDYLCVVGENGSGKSTLIKTLLRLMPPLDGEIITGGGLKSDEIGYMPQQTVVQRDFPAAVREIVLSGCLNRCGLRPFFNRQEKAIAEQSMEKLGISKLARQCYRELSGGQQQRVLLARALCATRKLLLLDEPAAGLDPHAMSEMYSLIEDLAKTEGITIIMISHDTSAAMRYASHILHIGNSRSLFFGTRDEYAKSDIGRAYLATEGGDAV